MWKEIDKTNGSGIEEMEAFIREHENGHFMQMPNWGDVKTYWRWCGICIYKKEVLVATISVLIRFLPLGFSIFYIPRGPVCDRNDPSIWREIMEALKHLARKYHTLLVHMDPDELDANDDFRMLMQNLGFRETMDDGFGNIQPQHVFRLNLKEKTKEQVFNAFSAKTRYNIRLAQRKDVVIQEYSGADHISDTVLEIFYSMMKMTGDRDRFFVREPSYFRGLMNALKDGSRMFIAYLYGQPIAGSIEIFCGKKAWYLYGASANEHRNVMPNYMLQWTMIQRAMERGCEMYDFRGVPGKLSEDHPLYGLYRFKKGFSGEYTKFTGLFTYKFKPVCSTIFQFLVKIFRNLRPKTRNRKRLQT